MPDPMRYSDTVMDHFMNPRNTGQLTDADGIGMLGSAECGDVLRVWIKVKDNRLTAVRHQVLGCPAAIAACSMMTELAAGLTLMEAANLTDAQVALALGGLPPQKLHCSNLAASALHKAVENYQTAQQHPAQTVTITALVNNVMPKPLQAEHGLSFWIEYGGRHILFDTGQTDALVKNADLLDIDLSKTDAIVLSHGHYDHTGGLTSVLDLAPNAIVCLHPDAPRVRFSCASGKPPKNVSMPNAACQKIAALAADNRLIYSGKPETLYPGVTLTGPIPRLTAYEDTGGPFYLDQDANTPDTLEDDQALTIATAKGLIVILGCAHAGLINTLDYVTTLRQKPICAIIGGTHLRAASPQRMESTFKALKRYNLPLIAPCHCTGPEALKRFENFVPTAFWDLQNRIRITI